MSLQRALETNQTPHFQVQFTGSRFLKVCRCLHPYITRSYHSPSHRSIIVTTAPRTPPGPTPALDLGAAVELDGTRSLVYLEKA